MEENKFIAASTLIIHRMISRSINVAVTRAEEFSQQGFEDEGLEEGYTKYLTCLMKNLEHHHLVEDEIMFPFFQDRLPNIRFDHLVEDHHKITALIEAVNSKLADGEGETTMKGHMDEILPLMTNISDLWFDHIEYEEDIFINIADDFVSQDESLALLGNIDDFRNDLFEPFSLTLPFILFNLEPDDRKIMAMELPPEFTEELIPHVWKEEWESMSPFFVDDVNG